MLMPYVLGIVLLQYYSAVLLSHLTVKDSTSPFRNLQDVLDDGSYEIACFYPSFLYDMISVSFKWGNFYCSSFFTELNSSFIYF